jgi:hypothetical protein
MDILSKINGNTLSATEFNQIPAELEALQTSSGQTSSDAILNQVSIATSRYAANNFYIDSGTANAYVLTLAASMTNPVNATIGYFVGMEIKFRAGNRNTGASTVNVNSAGVKNLKKEDGSTDLVAGDITTTHDSTFRYNGTLFVRVIEANLATTSISGTTLLPSLITIANNATDANNDIDFSAGNFTVSDGSAQGVASSVETKRLDATWAAGNNAGGLAAGLTKANSTTYHCFKLLNPTTGATGSGFDTSLNATNLLADSAVIAAGFTKYRRVFSILTDGSGNIRAFTMRILANGQASCILTNNIVAFSGTSPTDGTDLTITTPTGLNTGAILSGSLNHSGGGDCIYKLKSKVQGDYIYAGTLGNVNVTRSTIALPIPIVTNATSQIQHGRDATGGSCTIVLYLHGWVDYQL